MVAPPAGLKLGKSGPEVRQLQAALVKLGYLAGSKATAAKGTFDRATWEALANFKADHGLRKVGVYGGRAAEALKAALAGQVPEQKPAPAPARPEKPAPVKAVDVGTLKDLTWDKTADIVRAHGGKVCPNGQPPVLAVRTRNTGTAQYEDAFVVLRPDGKMKVFAATTRPTATTSSSGAYSPTMVVPGNYEIWPRWRDGNFNNDAFIIGKPGGNMTVQAAVDRNGDGRYSKSELANPVSDNEIRLHRGNSNSTSSAGCFNVQDYDGFLKFLGGRDSRFNLTLVEA